MSATRKPLGVRELKNRTSQIVNEIREHSAEYVVTVRGRPVAVLRPYGEADEVEARREEARAALAEADEIADQVERGWRSDRSALELLSEQRR